MSAGGALQAALVEALATEERMTGIYDGPPARAAFPYAVLDAGSESDWSHKNGEGREVLAATAHGINDVAPLPTWQRLVSGESLRPPSPCHLKVLQEGIAVRIQWTRRSHRGWSWTDGFGDADDSVGELYKLTITGPAGQIMIECTGTTATLPISEFPATPGQSVSLSVVTVGPMALSRAAATTFIV